MATYTDPIAIDGLFDSIVFFDPPVPAQDDRLGYSTPVVMDDLFSSIVFMPGVPFQEDRLGYAMPIHIDGDVPGGFLGYGAARAEAKAARKAISTPVGTGQDTTYATAVNTMITKRASLLAGLNAELSVAGTNPVPGVLLKAQAPINRVIHVYDMDSGELVGSAFSDGTGHFSIPGIANGDYYITAHDFGAVQNTSIIQNITV